MDKAQESTKKCFCARCFLPVDADDRVEIEGQGFHRFCSMCCVCRAIPSTVKMFYGHVFCNDCFKTHVLSRFRGENPRAHSNSWWMQWAPGAKPDIGSSENKDKEETEKNTMIKEEPLKRCICTRCLQAVEERDKVNIGGQHFHLQCAKCYFCHAIPKDNVKVYYGQVFCEECFNKNILNRSKDNPSEFFKNCFEQWQNNTQFAENMREFLAGNKTNAPLIFMMQGQQPPFCRYGTGPQEWFQSNEPKKSATPAVSMEDESLCTWDLSFENRTEVSDFAESCNAVKESANLERFNVSAAEKIEKLTKYLHETNLNAKRLKKWKNFDELSKTITSDNNFYAYCGWVDMQDQVSGTQLDCPKCLWQCGPIYVNSEYLQKVCEDNE